MCFVVTEVDFSKISSYLCYILFRRYHFAVMPHPSSLVAASPFRPSPHLRALPPLRTGRGPFLPTVHDIGVANLAWVHPTVADPRIMGSHVRSIAQQVGLALKNRAQPMQAAANDEDIPTLHGVPLQVYRLNNNVKGLLVHPDTILSTVAALQDAGAALYAPHMLLDMREGRKVAASMESHQQKAMEMVDAWARHSVMMVREYFRTELATVLY